MYFRNEQEWQKKLIKELAEKYGIDIRVVRQMVYYPYLFTKAAIAQEDSCRPIRHRHMGVFLSKKVYERKLNETKVVENS